MRVLVSANMEGAAGVVDGEDVRSGEGACEHNRGLLTAEANAAVRGVYACEPGAQVLVTEAHGPFRNLVPEKLDRRAELLRGKPKPDGMLADREAIAEAMGALRFDGPVRLEVHVLMPHMTERALLIPGVERAGGCTLNYRAPDFPTAYQVTQLITMLGGI